MQNKKKERLSYLLPIRCILFLSIFIILSFMTKSPYVNLSKWWTLIAIFVNIITLGILLFYCRQKSISYVKLIHYEKGKTKFKPTFIIVTTILLVGMIGLFFSGFIFYGDFPYLDKTMIEPIPLWMAIIVLFFLPLTTTLAEDGLYLGYAINSNTNHKWLSILSASFFYALQHSFIPFLPDGRFILYRFFSFLPLTFIMCFWYKKNKNPIPFMIGHFLLNVATAAQILMMTLSPDLFNSL